MTEGSTVLDWRGHTMVDKDGDNIGKIQEIYLDEQTEKPEWALVNTGLFGSKSSFVPLAGALISNGGICVPYEKGHVKDAPKIDADQTLSQDEEATLYLHYGLEYGGGNNGVGPDASGPNTADAMTRSEEELAVGKAQRERGRVRLRKYVVTEEVQQTVPVQREEVRVEPDEVRKERIEVDGDGDGGSR